MSVKVNKLIRKLSSAERTKVEDRAAEIIAEEISSPDLRNARKLTQARHDARHQSGRRFTTGRMKRPIDLDALKDG
jgi:hypothetical protein